MLPVVRPFGAAESVCVLSPWIAVCCKFPRWCFKLPGYQKAELSMRGNGRTLRGVIPCEAAMLCLHASYAKLHLTSGWSVCTFQSSKRRTAGERHARLARTGNFRTRSLCFWRKNGTHIRRYCFDFGSPGVSVSFPDDGNG